MAVSGIRSKTQADMNKDLAKKWTHEMQKRNEYFQQFGITIMTFTDNYLVDMNKCFQAIKYYLEKRKPEQQSIEQLINEIVNF